MKRARKASSRGVDAGTVHPAAVVVDLGFDDLMTDQEITSMHSQLGYVYSINRTAKRPFSAVVHTGFSPATSPRLWNKMGKAQWPRWARMWFMKDDVGDIAKVLGKTEDEVEAEGGAAVEGAVEAEPEAQDTEHVESSAPAPAAAPASGAATPFAHLERRLATTLPSTIPRTHKLVYLSADADEELTTLAEDEVYILGGIVDRNRHKVGSVSGLGARGVAAECRSSLSCIPPSNLPNTHSHFLARDPYSRPRCSARTRPRASEYAPPASRSGRTSPTCRRARS